MKYLPGGTFLLFDKYDVIFLSFSSWSSLSMFLRFIEDWNVGGGFVDDEVIFARNFGGFVESVHTIIIIHNKISRNFFPPII